jgi:hypothetical protein
MIMEIKRVLDLVASPGGDDLAQHLVQSVVQHARQGGKAWKDRMNTHTTKKDNLQ